MHVMRTTSPNTFGPNPTRGGIANARYLPIYTG